ncbi:MAG: DUF1631 family protein [Gammaproteobacteria bacterium]
MNERRRHSRIPVFVRATLIGPDLSPRACTIRDYCKGGLFIAWKGKVTASPLSRGDGVTIQFRADEPPSEMSPLEMPAAIARVFAGGVGVAFTEAFPSALAALKRIAERQRETPKRAGNPQLLREIENLCDRHLQTMSQEFLERASSRLFECANNAKSNMDQSDFLENRAELSERGQSIISGVTREIHERLQDVGRPQAREEFQAGAETLNLSLMGKDEFEDFLAVSELTSRAEHQHKDVLFALQQRFFSHAVSPQSSKSGLPFSPGIVFRSLAQALRQTRLKAKASMELYALGGRVLTPALGILYQEINQFLIDQGVLTDLSAHQRSKAPKPIAAKAHRAIDEQVEPAPGQDGDPPPFFAGPSGGPAFGPASLWAHMRQCLDASGGPMGNTARDSGVADTRIAERTSSNPAKGERYSPVEIAEALSRLQTEPSPPGDMEMLERVNSILSARHGPGRRVGERQARAIDMVGHLVNAIEAEDLTSTFIKTQLQGLRLALSKLAIQDEEFLVAESHPVRRALNHLARLDSLVPHDDPLRESSRRLMSRMVEDLNRGAAVKADLLHDVDRLVEQQSTQYEERVQELVERHSSDRASHAPAETESVGPPGRHREWDVWLERAKGLCAGDGVEFKLDSDPPKRLQLAWVGEGHRRFVFADGAGQEAASMSLQGLATHLLGGTARISADAELPLIDRAVRSSLYHNHNDLEWRAHHDPLTGLLNRARFVGLLEQAVIRAREEGTRHCLVYADLNSLRLLSDRWGREAADAFLAEVAGQVRAYAEGAGATARLVDDHFAVLLEQASAQQSVSFAEGLVAKFDAFRFKWEHQRFRVSLAAGVVPLSSDNSDAEAMLAEAANACQAARESSASRVHVYQVSTKEIEGEASSVENWGRWLEQALSTRQLPLYVQPVLPVIQRTAFAPIYALSAGSEDKSIFYPSCLAGPAEERLQAFDRLLIREVLCWMANNQNTVIELECCGIHLGEHSVRDPGLMEHVLGLFSEIAVPPGKVCFHIPNAVVEKHFVQTERFVLTLKEFGCRFALDDFEGPSGSGYLDRLPVDYLGMSGALVQGLIQNPDDKALAQSINGIGHMIGKRTIAKGVRDEALLAVVRSIGVDYAQGMEPIQALGDFTS